MKSYKSLSKLKGARSKKRISKNQLSNKLNSINKNLNFIEYSIATEEIFSSIYNQINIPDQLTDAYKLAFNDVSKEFSLYERYLQKVEDGPKSVQGFIGTLKGKLGEIKFSEQLQEQYPGWEFELASNVNQPFYDIIGTSPEGEQLLIQSKVGGKSYTGDVLEKMGESPEIHFTVSDEIESKILEDYPEYSDQLIPEVNINDFEITEETEGGLEQLADNLGIDLPDEIGDLIPYLAEIRIAIRLILDFISSGNNFNALNYPYKIRIQAFRLIYLLIRFGTTTIIIKGMTQLASAATYGTADILGTISGAYLASKINKSLAPRYQEFALLLVGFKPEDLIYFTNKKRIDYIGYSLMNTANLLTEKNNFKNY